MKFLFALFLTLTSLSSFAQKNIQATMNSNAGVENIVITGAAAQKLYETLNVKSVTSPWGFNNTHWTDKRSNGITCSFDLVSKKKYECIILIDQDGIRP